MRLTNSTTDEQEYKKRISTKLGKKIQSLQFLPACLDGIQKDKTIEFILNNTSKRTIYFFQNVITIDDNGIFNMEPNFIGLATLDLSIKLDKILLKNNKNMIRDNQFGRIKIFIIKNK